MIKSVSLRLRGVILGLLDSEGCFIDDNIEANLLSSLNFGTFGTLSGENPKIILFFMFSLSSWSLEPRRALVGFFPPLSLVYLFLMFKYWTVES